MKNLIDRINKTHSISKNSWGKLNELLKVKTYPPHHVLVEHGKVTDTAYYLINGIARSYFISKEGKVVNSILYSGNVYLAEYTSLILKTPTMSIIETLTKCEVIECKYSEFIKLSDKYFDINTLHRKNLEKFYISLQKQDLDLANLNSTERYLKLIKEMPKIETQITQKNIALHLGITQVQLSRLKKQLYHS